MNLTHTEKKSNKILLRIFFITLLLHNDTLTCSFSCKPRKITVTKDTRRSTQNVRHTVVAELQKSPMDSHFITGQETYAREVLLRHTRSVNKSEEGGREERKGKG